ncbi:hypothetical protein SE955_21675 [Escherichia coli]|nr:hypothetical protein [Escherichia coli]
MLQLLLPCCCRNSNPKSLDDGDCGGVERKMVLGEVIISERVIYYESAAALEGGKFAPRPEILCLHMPTKQNLNTYLATTSLSARLGERAQAIGLEMPENSQAGDVAAGIIVSSATIASGELLIRDPALLERFRSLHDKACVAEMEAYGVFDACEKQGVPALIVRGISDFGDSTKDDAFHSIASVAAAIITADYLQHGWIRA